METDYYILRGMVNFMFKRASGVLMHISSLPGDYGIGCFGKEALRFIDFLDESGTKYWQVLPFTPTDSFNSPYASISAFAGNPYFIDLEQLFEAGLLTETELNEQKYANPYTAAFEFLAIGRISTLYKAFTRIDESLDNKVKKFAEENTHWLEDYALYIILKEANLGKEWFDWDNDIKLREPEALAKAREEYADTIHFIGFMQYLFFSQWKKVRAYASEKGVEIIGDLPMYVAMQSSDVWSNRELFDLDEFGRGKNVAGVPPDYFSELGQKWGNALYDWNIMKKDGYKWWINRLKVSFELFDVVRIDHFRAFSAYWAVPADAPSAKTGEWIDGPKMDFFDKVFEVFGEANIIAEDLGLIDDGVIELIEQTDFPGMRIMQFGFIEEADNVHLPHNYPKNSFCYTGTHDNNTILGWLWEATPEQRKWALDYCGFKGDNWAEGGWHSQSCRAMINALWQSPSNVVIVPVQDLCGFGTDTKMNIPGVPNGNWAFRLSREHLNAIDKAWLSNLNAVYKRNK